LWTRSSKTDDSAWALSAVSTNIPESISHSLEQNQVTRSVFSLSAFFDSFDHHFWSNSVDLFMKKLAILLGHRRRLPQIFQNPFCTVWNKNQVTRSVFSLSAFFGGWRGWRYSPPRKEKFNRHGAQPLGKSSMAEFAQ